MDFLEKLEALRDGEIVLIYDKDGREEETDLTVLSDKITPKKIAFLRNNGGGLICQCIHPKVAEKLQLPYMHEIYKEASDKYQTIKMFSDSIPYDRKSSFSLSINHIDTYTGITDNDRSKTITEMAKYTKEATKSGKNRQLIEKFSSNFRIPGHVPLLIGDKKLIYERYGHTELSLALALIANTTPSTTICEMMDQKSGEALNKENAKKFAKDNNLAFFEGIEIEKHFRENFLLKYK